MLGLQLRLLLAALRVYSRLPVARALAAAALASADGAAHRARYLPAVGIVVALLVAVLYATVALWLPHPLSIVIAIAAGLALTGAVHERGLADVCRVIAARTDAARQTGLADGAHAGALAVAVAVLARYEALSSIDPSWVAVTLVSAAAFSRGCALLSTAGTPAGPGRQDLAVAGALALLPAAVGAWWTGAGSVFAAAVLLAAATALFTRRVLRAHAPLDSERALDALQQATELAYLAGVVATLTIDDETAADSTS